MRSVSVGCKKVFTAWKYIGKLGIYYHYYTLDQKSLSKEDKRNHRIESVHDGFRELLRSLTPRPEILNLLKWVFEEAINTKKKLHKSELKNRKTKIDKIDKRIEKVSNLYEKPLRTS